MKANLASNNDLSFLCLVKGNDVGFGIYVDYNYYGEGTSPAYLNNLHFYNPIISFGQNFVHWYTKDLGRYASIYQSNNNDSTYNYIAFG